MLDGSMSRSRALVTVVLALGLVVTAGALAQGVIAHEFVPNAGADDGSSLVSSAGSAEPAAIMVDGALVPPPAGGSLRDGERAMRSAPGDGAQSEEVGRRSPTFRPDRVTALPGAVGYFEVFTPTITPYKRVTALDGVALAGSVPVLAVADVARARVPIEGAGSSAPDARPRDRFWGSVVLDFSDGPVVPLPSVSPESRILTLRTEPPSVPIHLERDHADNFYVSLDAPLGTIREVRVIFLTDAPRTYFGFDDGAVLPTAPSDALVAEVPVLPDAVERDALQFAGELGVSRGDPFDRVLNALVAHFRAFEESEEPPADTGNIYLDLARGMRGVCRHRAYAFAITAMALGIPTRFVNNEAHAWVEVHMPERRGWLRVDLGGSAQGLVSRSADRGPAYAPDVHDPLPRPDAYQRALAASDRTSHAPGSDASSTSSTPSPSMVPSLDPRGGTGTTTDPAADPPATDPLGLDGTTPPPPPRAPLALTLDRERWEVLRGQTFEVTGTATSRGAPADGARIEVLLRDERGNEQLLGVTVSDARGVFHASFGVPPDATVGERRLIVRSPASARYVAASVD
jgi:hypothetical protein